MQIQIDVKGTEQIKKRISQIAKIDFRPPLTQVSSELKTEYQDRSFSQEGANLGSKWKARKGEYAHPPLQKTGKMRRSFKTAVKPREAVISNTASYFPYHQLGTRKMPARKMMGLTNEITKKIINIFDRYVKKLLK